MGSKYINPYNLFVGAFIPNWLLRRREISHGAKLCYARLMQFSGRGGDCRPGIERLSHELAIGQSQTKEYLRELVGLDLIERDRRGLGMTNRYLFLWHPWMDEIDDWESGSLDSREVGSADSRDDGYKKIREKREGDTNVSRGLPSEQSLVSPKQEDFKLDARSLPDDISEVIEAWEGQLSLPRVRTFAGKRAGSIRRALKDPFWREHWRDALSKLIKTPLLMGKGKISWRADLDWFLEPRNIEKLINGVYDDPNQKPPTRDYTRETI